MRVPADCFVRLQRRLAMMWLFENAQGSHVQKPLGEWNIWSQQEEEDLPGQPTTLEASVV